MRAIIAIRFGFCKSKHLEKNECDLYTVRVQISETTSENASSFFAFFSLNIFHYEFYDQDKNQHDLRTFQKAFVSAREWKQEHFRFPPVGNIRGF